MGSVNAIGIYLSVKDLELLERRKKVGPTVEQNTTQRIIMSIATGWSRISGNSKDALARASE